MGTVAGEERAERLVEAITRRVQDVPLLPSVVSRLLEVVGREDHSINDVVRLIENDLSLTTRVLKVANCAAFGRGQTITSLSRATLHLGEKMVIGIAIGSCSPQLFQRPLEGYGSAAGELWDHSLRTALATREVVRYAHHEVSSDLAFTAGLLHDVGKALISEFLEGQTGALVQSCREGHSGDFLAAEQMLLGTDHAEIGYALARRWSLPDPLCAALRDHHRPDLALDFRELVFGVHLGDLAAMLGGSGTGADTLAYKVETGYEEYLRLDKDDLDRILLIVQDEFRRTKASIFSELEAGR
ncbi:MAG: HDOD domain-containing protein [Candidatus Zixiibacteriota bacterium]|nr:MAG: HDOD domain-containing protein [candidate division Zixibacteria bacterium]